MSPPAIRRAVAVIVSLQVVILVFMPVLAGPRIPSGTTVRLVATAGQHPDLKEMPREEVWFDYGLDKLSVPRGMYTGDEVYVELLKSGGSHGAVNFGKVVRAPNELADDAIWVKLWVSDKNNVEAGPMVSYVDSDQERIARLQEHLSDGGKAEVVVLLDNDGDPTIKSVTAER